MKAQGFFKLFLGIIIVGFGAALLLKGETSYAETALSGRQAA